jgi:hypothetical protein
VWLSAPIVLHVNLSSDWWPSLVSGLIGALIGGGAVIWGSLLSSRLTAKRERQLRSDRLRLDWLGTLLTAAKDVYYGARIAQMRLGRHFQSLPDDLPPEFRVAEWKSDQAVGDLVMFGGRVGSPQIGEAVEQLMTRAGAVRNASDLATLTKEWDATAHAFNVVRGLLFDEVTLILEGGRRPAGTGGASAPPPADSGGASANEPPSAMAPEPDGGTDAS